MKFVSLFVSFVFISFVFISCAQQRIVLDQKMKPFDGLDQVSTFAFATLPIKISGVTDARPVGVVVGEARTGAQYEKTPVYTTEAPEAFVESYLTDALKKREALIVQQDQKVELNVTINELWVEEVIEQYQPEKAKCKVELEVNAQKNGEAYNGKFWTEITSPGDMADGTEKIQPTLASCMNAVSEKIVKDKKFGSFVKAQPLL